MLPCRFQQEHFLEHDPPPPLCLLEGGGGVMFASSPPTMVVGCGEGGEIHLLALALVSSQWDLTGQYEDARVLSLPRRLVPPVAVYCGSVDHDCYLEAGEKCHPLWRPPVGLM